MLKLIGFIWSHPLASRNRLEAFTRFLRWQVGARCVGHPVVVPFVQGTSLVAEVGMTGMTLNVYCGLHEFTDMAFTLHFLRSDDLFLDVGANVGSYTVLASGVAGARSWAVEPVPETYRSLLRNIRFNELSARVQTTQAALGESSGEIEFMLDRGPTNQVARPGLAGKIGTVPLRRLDDLLGGSYPTMIKVDVEGYEEQVLKGGPRALENRSLNAAILEGDSPGVRDLMMSNGFRRASYDPFSRELALSESARPSSLNTLWIRDQGHVQDRCRSAPTVEVVGTTF